MAMGRLCVGHSLLPLYQRWFAIAKGDQEKDYPECMPAYVKNTRGILFDYVKHLLRLRTGAHTPYGLKVVQDVESLFTLSEGLSLMYMGYYSE
jgi:hypothetical protein